MNIRKRFYDVNMRQLELMAHALGFDRKRIRYNKHECYRNHFLNSTRGGTMTMEQSELDNLVEKGLMKSRKMFGEEQTIYYVAEWGFMLFSEIYHCRVFEIK